MTSSEINQQAVTTEDQTDSHELLHHYFHLKEPVQLKQMIALTHLPHLQAVQLAFMKPNLVQVRANNTCIWFKIP